MSQYANIDHKKVNTEVHALNRKKLASAESSIRKN